MVGVPTLEQILAELSPLPIAEGTATAYAKGWVKAYYFDPINKLQVKFTAPPSVVATAEARSGSPPTVNAPNISIPSIELPSSPTISIPTITLPSLPEITIPTVDLSDVINSLNNVKNYRFVYGVFWAPIGDALNKMMDLWNTAINDLQNVLFNIQTALINAHNNLQDIVKSLTAASTNTQTALNTYQASIQTSLNAGLADLRDKAQASLNSFHDFIQTSLNSGLSQVIPTLYDQIGVPLVNLITPVQIRNVQADSFEFYALSPGYTIHYVAIGLKA